MAASRNARVADGLVYFPGDDVRTDLLPPSDTTSRCGRKGLASYADVVVGDAVCVDAAWTYRQPTAAAFDLAGCWAFWRDAQIVEDGDLLRAWSAQTRQWLDT